jgi:hypothetical protein
MVDGRNSRRPFFDIQMAHYKHRGGKYHRRWPAGGPRSFRLDDQWPKNSHNRMITGMGTPISQSKSPRPIAASLKPYGFKTQKGRFGFRRK